MADTHSAAAPHRLAPHLIEQLAVTRQHSLDLAAHLSDADQTVQSMPDASPAKWHLAHTTWFFETFILRKLVQGYVPFNEDFGFLFNSYYEHEGPRHARDRRGMLTRPSADDVRDYRMHVDQQLMAFFDIADENLADQLNMLVELGINHEQQHQELLLTDILHLFSHNPLYPALMSGSPVSGPRRNITPGWTTHDGGIVDIGHTGAGYHFDNEGPVHQVLLRPFQLADTLVTNRDWLAFMDDGGYSTPTLWLSDGWATVKQHDWTAPLYWERHDNGWHQFSLWGLRRLDPEAPVCHVSYYEADAYARWTGMRLPTEFEWEHAAAGLPATGNTADTGHLRPLPAGHGECGDRQMFGDVWEWTQSPYSPYPRFKAAEGAVGEYNGKFMINQMVLKGGSCATPGNHIRHTYRNFFYPHQRWQFMGLRLAKDA